VTPRLYASLDDVLVAVLERQGNTGCLGWVTATRMREEIPDCPDTGVLDVDLRRLIRAGTVEVWDPDRPPTSYRQQLRIVRPAA